MKKVAFYTLGCKVNQYETEAMTNLFINDGYEVINFEDVADVYVINTCTVTNLSARKSRQIIRRANNKNQDAIVAVIGCYSQESSEEVSGIYGVSIVVGTKERHKIIDYVNDFKNKNEKINVVDDIKNEKSFEKMEINNFNERSRAYIKIQDGCSQFCSYCIIPYTRGPIRSRELDDIIDEVKKLTNAGFQEFVLTGIHLASYGKDNKKVTLIDVLSQINEIQDVKRIRLGSLEPLLINQEFIDGIKNLDKLCPHFHVALQSGCDETLKRMNRKYTTKEYYEAVNLLRENLKDVAITTDIIVGFPGEADNEFDETYKFLEKIQFSNMHIFKYSPRKGTKSADFSDQIDGNIKDERSKKLHKLASLCNRKFNEKFIGKELEVMFEQVEKETDIHGYIEGVTANYIKVIVKGNTAELKNKMHKILLKKIEGENIIGEVIF